MVPGLVLMTFASTCILFAQTYRLANNTADDNSPRLRKDKDGRLWCFWRSNQDTTSYIDRIWYRAFEQGRWSEPNTVVGTASRDIQGFDVDIDRQGNLWLAKLLGGSVALFKKKGTQEFDRVSAFPDNRISAYGYNAISISAVDSNRIWIFYQNAPYLDIDEPILKYDGETFETYTMYPCTPLLCESQVKAVTSFNVPSGRSYFLRNGIIKYPGAFVYPYLELLCVTEEESIFFAGKNTQSAEGAAGLANDSLAYFFHQVKKGERWQVRLDISGADSSRPIKQLEDLNFFPTAVSKEGKFLVTGWFKNNWIYLKAIGDTTFYKTDSIPEVNLLADTSRANLEVLADSLPYAWVAWQGKIAGQNEIFVAHVRLNTEVDDDILVGVTETDIKNNNFRHAFHLAQNYPNPFNPGTTISFSLPHASYVTLKVFNILGSEIETLVSREMSAGDHIVKWNAGQRSSGIYFYRLTAGEFIVTKKLILIR